MRVIACTTATPRFEWEVEVPAHNLRTIGRHDIQHNTGVRDSSSGLFHQEEWADTSPFHADIAVDENSCSHLHVKAIRAAAETSAIAPEEA